MSFCSLQHGRTALLHTVVAAVLAAGARPVVAHGGSLDALPAGAVGGAHLRQRPLLARARLLIGHGGLNTVLDAAAAGVPQLLLPLAFEQPSIAARARSVGIGTVLPPAARTPAALTAAVRAALADDEQRQRALALARLVPRSGAARAAELIERAARAERPVFRVA